MQNRTRVLSSVVAVLAVLPLVAPAQQFPVRPARMLIPYSAGGFVDVLGRTVGNELSQAWKQAVVVENMPGANTIIATENCKNSPADGHTLCMITIDTMSLNPHLYSKLPYAASDLAPITNLVFPVEVLVVAPSLNARTVQELVAVARARPGQLNYASFGIGGNPHLVTETIAQRFGLQMTHVPFKGAPPAMQALLGGEVQVMYATFANAAQQIRSGKLVALTVAGQTRSALLPAVPCFAEVGLGDLGVRAWFGLAVPAGTPQAIVRKIHADIVRGFQKPEFKQFFDNLGLEPVANSPEDFARFLKADYGRGAEMVKRANVRLD